VTDKKNPSIWAFISKWIFIPLALIAIFMIYWGVAGPKLIIIEPVKQGKRAATGVVSNLDLSAGTLQLDVDEAGKKEQWKVVFKPNVETFYYEVVADSPDLKERLKTTLDKDPELLKDGITLTVIGPKSANEIKANNIHIGGAYNPPEVQQRKENVSTYNTADKLCIACVGLGDSEMIWLWYLLYILMGFLAVYGIVEVITRRRGAA